jgi:hypothetical protein
MIRHRWLFAVSSVVLLGSIGRIVLNPVISRGADRRIGSEEFFRVEEESGVKLYAPTTLPSGVSVSPTGTIRGARRMLQDFSNQEERSVLIMAQEPRSEDRDRYNHSVFIKPALARARVKGQPAYFINGSSGERRLFWNEPETAIILSSMVLDDRNLLEIAESVR